MTVIDLSRMTTAATYEGRDDRMESQSVSSTCAERDTSDLDCAAGILTALLISAVLWTLAGLLVWGLAS